jgi:hypothetical protein
MLAVIAAILFGIAFILRATSTATDVVFSPFSLLLVGFVLLALHLAGWARASRIPAGASARHLP